VESPQAQRGLEADSLTRWGTPKKASNHKAQATSLNDQLKK
jgi:hypothetical protein